MWFKNLRIYRLTKPLDSSAEALEEQLQQQKFNACTNLDFSSYGWVPPMGKNSELFTHTLADFAMICARKQEKILPAAAVNEIVEERVEEFESNQARNVYRKERRNMKEEVVHSLLPKALTRSSLVYAYFSKKQKLLIIDTASTNKAEEFLEHLRATLGSLSVVPLATNSDITNIMTRWVKDRVPKGFELDNDCELQNPKESTNIVRCKNQELESDEILNHIKAGKRIIQLGIIWRNAIRFSLSDDFSIKRLRFEEIIQEQAESDAEDRATQFDQDFAVMTLQLSQLIDDLLKEFGGIEED